ncbi:MAG: septum formation initiator family protein [Candidatus Moranbacteria bacterium]|nr:septum formation initiator family protein [Candidatus Moranbacteria bacterium]
MLEKNPKKLTPLVVKIIFLIGVVALIYVSVSLSREFQKKRQIQEEIRKLQEEAQKISRENSAIQEKIAYLESHDYQEKEAKDKLNLQKPDEKVVVVRKSVSEENRIPVSQEEIAETVPEKPSIPNYQKWWNYFFGKNL